MCCPILSNALFFLFFPHMHVLISWLHCKLPKERHDDLPLVFSVQLGGSLGSMNYWELNRTHRERHNSMNSTGDPTYNLPDKQIPRNNVTAGFVLLVCYILLYVYLAKSVWVWCLKIGFFHTKCHLDKHLVFREEQNSLLTVDGKLSY